MAFMTGGIQHSIISILCLQALNVRDFHKGRFNREVSEIRCKMKIQSRAQVSAEVWQRLRTLLSLIEQHVADLYPIGESRSEATWRTILANVSSAGYLPQSDVRGLGFDLWSRMPQSDQEITSPTAQQAMIQSIGAASSATHKRGLFFTQEGDIDLAPKGAGDQIYLLFGAEVPYVLRRKGDDLQTFEVVGECYCHSIIEGEMLAAGRTPLESKIV